LASPDVSLPFNGHSREHGENRILKKFNKWKDMIRIIEHRLHLTIPFYGILRASLIGRVSYVCLKPKKQLWHLTSIRPIPTNHIITDEFESFWRKKGMKKMGMVKSSASFHI